MVADVRARHISTGWMNPPVAAAPVRPETAHVSVLVVDDDPDVLEIAREFLLRGGFRVLTAGGGAQALELFRECGGEIDVVVLDLSMPDVDGDATFFAIRNLRSDARVVIVSGYPESMAADQFTATSAADGFLSKPYLPEALIASVRGAVSR